MYIVQEVVGGVAYEPSLFFKEAEANEFFVQLVNEYRYTHTEDGEEIKKAQDAFEADRYISEGLLDNDVDVKYWVI